MVIVTDALLLGIDYLLKVEKRGAYLESEDYKKQYVTHSLLLCVCSVSHVTLCAFYSMPSRACACVRVCVRVPARVCACVRVPSRVCARLLAVFARYHAGYCGIIGLADLRFDPNR